MKFSKLNCSAKFYSENNDSNLMKVKLMIVHPGRNRNYSSISKETINDAMESVKNIPILGYVKRDDNGDIADFDGHNMETTGSAVIFEGTGLSKLEDFSINETYSEANGIATLTSVARNINEIENLYGVAKVVVIQSQMGVPICAYGGNSVYWEIPDDLPKTTKLMIDGKPLYIHRANYVMMDVGLLN